MLCDLTVGQSGIIKNLCVSETIKQRLLELGFVPGATVTCVGTSPLGDPKAYMICGTVIALRLSDSAGISLAEISEQSPPCPDQGSLQEMPKKQKLPEKTVALAGNPNVGKSTVFNQLTGMHQHTGNWPGKTVASASGIFQTSSFRCRLIDLPGTYSLLAHSCEEEITRDYLLGQNADAVLVVCDATCLERNLHLVLQILTITRRVLVCVNMMDEAANKQIEINLNLLSEKLGVPCIAITARKKKSLKPLLAALDRLLADTPESVSALHTAKSQALSSQEASHHVLPPDTTLLCQKAAAICREAVIFHNPEYRKGEQVLDRIVTGKYSAYPFMLLLLALIFWLTMVGANYPSALLSRLLFSLEEPLFSLLNAWQVPDFLCRLLTQGMYRVLAWVVSVMLPPMAIFFPLFSLFEDSGYLPRLAYNLDKPFRKCHACGKQALTMCMGFGCNAVGVTGCRIIDSGRERLLAILTNSFVPCNGRFPTMLALIAMFFTGSSQSAAFLSALILTGVILLGIGCTFAASWILSHTLLKGVPSSFTLELPPYRCPQAGRVLIRALFDRTLVVLGRAVTVALPAGLLIFLLANIYVGECSLYTHICNGLNPFASLLGLDGVILAAFLLGLPANEIVLPLILMGYTTQGCLVEYSSLVSLKELLIVNGWNFERALAVLLFCLLHWPCSTTLLTIKKEAGGLKWAVLAFLIPTLTGMLLLFLLHLAFTCCV